MSLEDGFISELCLGDPEIPSPGSASPKKISKSVWNDSEESDEEDRKLWDSPPFARKTPPPATKTPPSEEKKKEESATPEKEFKTPKELPIEIVVKRDTP